MGEDDHWGFVECLSVETLEIHIGLVGAIPRHPVIINTTTEALREHITPRKFWGYFRTERKRIAVEGDTRPPQLCSSRGKTIARSRQCVRRWDPADFPVNLARKIVEKRLS